MSGAEFRYSGDELDLFAHARNWKRYWSSRIRPYVAGDVLEVGAGLGANAEYLLTDAVRSWTSLEPDPRLAGRLRARAAGLPEGRSTVLVGTLGTIDAGARFDAILYIDVLEHIADDREELRRAAAHLRDGGFLVVVSPAHQFLFTEFDRAVGHHRRYDRKALGACAPPELALARLHYLDSAGILASLGNRLLLRKADPTQKQILFWDRALVPVSRVLDRALAFSVGKSIVGVWKKQ